MTICRHSTLRFEIAIMALTSDKKPYFGLTGRALTFWITFACSVDMLMFGYDQAVFSGVIVTQDFLEIHGMVGKTQLISTLAAIYDIGCFFGAIIAFSIGERLGRTKSIKIGTTIMSIGAILMTASFSLPQIFVGRIILGFVASIIPSKHFLEVFLTGFHTTGSATESTRRLLPYGKPRPPLPTCAASWSCSRC